MPNPRNQRSLMGVMDRSAGRSIGRNDDAMLSDIKPLLAAMKGAKSFAGMRKSLSKGKVVDMGTEATTEALGLEGFKAAVAGVASATPRDKR